MPPQSAREQPEPDALVKVFVPQGYLDGTREVKLTQMAIESELAKVVDAIVYVLIIRCESYGKIPGHGVNAPTVVEIWVAEKATTSILTQETLKEAVLAGLEKHGVPRGHVFCK